MLFTRSRSDADHTRYSDTDRYCVEDGHRCDTHATAVSKGDRDGHGGCKPNGTHHDPSANAAASPHAGATPGAAD